MVSGTGDLPNLTIKIQEITSVSEPDTATMRLRLKPVESDPPENTEEPSLDTASKPAEKPKVVKDKYAELVEK